MNTITVFGNLTKDPKRTETKTVAVTRFTVADNYGSGEKKGVNFWNVTAFGGSGDAINKYLKAGDPIIVSGTLKTNQYTDKDGNKREYTEINMNDFAFVPHERKSEAKDEAPAPDENPFA